jgi:TP901 family phage tail tape measure protein
MADRKIDININITGSTAGGTSGKGSSATQQREEAKRLTNQLKEEGKRQTADHTAELKKQAENAKRAYKEQTDAAKKASKEQIAETKKTTSANSNTWSNALKSYQFKFNALGNIISNVVSTATRMLAQLGKSVVTISKDFEFAMSGVRAITMATDQEFKLLRNDAIRLGGTTIFTATEVSKLQEELAKLGFTVNEIHSATDAVVALAAATGEDLGQSALVAGTIIRAFGMNANELTRVVDVMTESFNRSALDLYKFQETMKYVAPVASKVGYSVEEVTALMSKLADAGVVGSQAGTGLRNILLRLADANSKLSKAIGGSVNSLPELIVGFQKLEEAGLDATKALQLTDRYSITATLSIANATQGIWDMYVSLVANTGAAQKMADIRMDNFAGSVEKLKGEWDSFILTINKSNGALRKVVDAARWTVEQLGKLFATAETKAEISGQNLFNEFKDRMDMTEQSILSRSVIAQDKALKAYQAINNKTKEQYKSFQKEIRDIQINAKAEIVEARKQLVTELDTKKQEFLDAYGFDPSDFSAQGQILSAKMEMMWKGRDALMYERLIKDKIYYNNLFQLQVSYQERAIQAAIEEEQMLEEKVAQQKRYDDLIIAAMVESRNKEIAEVKLKYARLIDEAESSGWYKLVPGLENARGAEILKVTKEWDDKILKEQKRLRDEINKLMPQKKLPYAVFDPDKMPDPNVFSREYFKNVRDAFKKYGKEGIQPSTLGFSAESWSSEVVATLEDGTQIVNNTLKADLTHSEDDWNIFDKFIQDGLTDEQLSAIEQGVSLITNQLQTLLDQETEIADRRVENSERVVDQLQQDLQTEIALAEAGLANNVTLKKKELEEAKKRQAEALAAQEVALKKQQQMESVLQAVNLASALSGILKNTFTKLDPVTATIISLAASGALFGIWSGMKSQATDATEYGEGGEIAGKKHSQGGVPINAEGGEFMVKASAYAKNKELVQAINNEDMSNVYRALNQDLSVSLDDSDTARMLGRHFKDKKKVTYFNGYRVEELGNRRRVIRYAKV